MPLPDDFWGSDPPPKWTLEQLRQLDFPEFYRLYQSGTITLQQAADVLGCDLDLLGLEMEDEWVRSRHLVWWQAANPGQS